MTFSIFDEERVCFVHPPRCGGTTLFTSMLASGYPKQHFFYGTYAHQPAFEMRRFKAWKKAFRFTIVRNPWSRMVSMYNALFIKKLYRLPEYLPQISTKEAEFLGTQAKRLGFRWWLMEFKEQLWTYPQAFPSVSPGQAMCQMSTPQVCWLTTNGGPNGEVQIDKIFRFEDMTTTYDYLGIKHPDAIKGWTPYMDGSYIDYYDDGTKDLVAKRFADDIRRLSYEFEGPEFPHVMEDGKQWQKTKAKAKAKK